MGLNVDVESKATLDEVVDRAEGSGKDLLTSASGDLSTILASAKDAFSSILAGGVNSIDSVLSAQQVSLFNSLHLVLDRINGTRLTFTEGGLIINIPPRKIG